MEFQLSVELYVKLPELEYFPPSEGWWQWHSSCSYCIERAMPVVSKDTSMILEWWHCTSGCFKKKIKLKLIPYSFLCVICWKANTGRKHCQFSSLPVRGACVCICEQEIYLSASDIHKMFSPSFWREWLLLWLLADLEFRIIMPLSLYPEPYLPITDTLQ